ncbi:MAG: pitrilysin family protein [Candidatus Omnitrophica bacterium]|nr:pitrilysin family protein [Candidatus Omnitrophota bacterium]
MYKRAELHNGTRIIINPMRSMESVALGIWINTGGRFESERLKGISHYLEHLLFKGSAKYSCRSIKESIEGVGGALNAFTSEEMTCYFVKIPADRAALALDVLSDMVMCPLLRQDDIDKERTVILEEIKMYKDLPQSHVHELLDGLLWPGHPLGLSIAGSEESVKRLNRPELLGYCRERYTAANIVVSACGKFSPRSFVQQVSRRFSGLPRGSANTAEPVREKQAKAQLSLFHKETEQTHLALGFHGIRRDHPLKHAAGILHIVLGANMSSRLFNEVREKRGLAYEIGTQLKRYQDTGAFVVHAGVDNRKVEKALHLILRELEKTTRQMITQDEFRRARDFYLGQLKLALEDTLDHMFWIGESTAALGRTHTLAQVISQVSRLKRQDVMEVARYLFREDKINLALIGPLAARKGSIEKELRFPR